MARGDGEQPGNHLLLFWSVVVPGCTFHVAGCVVSWASAVPLL